jgi:hypothetical protein
VVGRVGMPAPRCMSHRHHARAVTAARAGNARGDDAVAVRMDTPPKPIGIVPFSFDGKPARLVLMPDNLILEVLMGHSALGEPRWEDLNLADLADLRDEIINCSGDLEIIAWDVLRAVARAVLTATEASNG